MKTSYIYHECSSPGIVDNLSSFFSEVKELIEAIIIFDKDGIIEEWDDVCIFICLIIYRWLKIDITLRRGFGLSSGEKYSNRIKIWRKIFKENGLKFSVKYLSGGSNYKKEDKVRRALYMAIKEQKE